MMNLVTSVENHEYIFVLKGNPMKHNVRIHWPRMVIKAMFGTIEYIVPAPDQKTAVNMLIAFKESGWDSVTMIDLLNDVESTEFSLYADDRASLDNYFDHCGDIWGTIDATAIEIEELTGIRFNPIGL